MSEFDGFISFEQGNAVADAKEPELVPNGRYLLTIQDARGVVEEINGENKLTQASVRVSIDKNVESGEEMVNKAPIFHTLFLPLSTDEPGKKETKGRFVKRFLILFKIPFTAAGISPSDFQGRSAIASVTLETYTRKDGTTGQKNSIVIPPLPKNM